MNDHSAVIEGSRLQRWGQCPAKVCREELSEDVVSLGLKDKEGGQPNKELGKDWNRKKYVQIFWYVKNQRVLGNGKRQVESKYRSVVWGRPDKGEATQGSGSQ